MIESVRHGERTGVRDALHRFMQRACGSGESRFIFAYAVLDVVLRVGRFIEELGGEVEAVVPPVVEVERQLTAEDPQAIEVFLLQILVAALEFRERRQADKYGDVIEKARAFIDEHFNESDLSLNTVAKVVNMSPSHFSTIFSHESGSTFIEYLTATRIRRAMDLLKSTSMRASEIAYQVGYGDPHYFSHVFKKQTGATPSAFRRCESETARDGCEDEP